MDAAPASSRRFSVLHVFKVFYPDLFGGTLTVIRDICAGLAHAVASSVLVCSDAPRPRHEIVNGIPVERVRSLGNLFSLPIAPTYPFRLWRRIAAYDLVALHAPFPLADLVFACGLGRARPLVVHWHADIVSHGRLRWLVEPLMRRTLQRAEAIIVSDAALATRTALLRDVANKCHVVPFGVDLRKFAALENSERPGSAGRRVVACGRLVPYKGFDVLIRAAADHDFEVRIIGEGRERAHLQQLIDGFGIADRVRLLGSLCDDEMVAEIGAADVFVMPSVTNAETFGLVQLEAMAAGRPIVNTALDTGVPRVARDGREAVTVPPGDAVALAGAINALLADPARRRRMGDAARQRAATHFATAAFDQGIERIYRRAVAAHAAAHRASEQGVGLLDSVRIAAALAWSDLRHRYVRSLLGPFWMSIQMAIMVAVLGSVISHFGPAGGLSRLPMLALSLTAWTFLNGVVLDATTALQASASLIKDRALPPVVFLLQCCFRQGLFALHNAYVPLALWLAIDPMDVGGVFAALPGVLLFIAFTFAASLVLGALATRFRDLKPIIESCLTLAFLASPVIWSPEMIDRGSFIMRVNPLTHLFAIWREPLATGQVPMSSVLYVVMSLSVLVVASLVTLSRLRKAAFWI
ncbi:MULTISPECIES: glycosyltransferase [Bradyrhizobium]|jgi:glycosyltransferase involved in cell wall biosynthesis/ABC-type polysaccharide/polyol phosphate export permease|uniref:Glycosyltransferase n=4 Tax=Bradyrhizobium TaxID=374 RepID=A0ABS5GHN1_9BRAD|nr:MULTISPECIES: glycosyltransferase [Bradyrhizobium]MBR1140833.1 glycosyltransferase [Bradyrhizobium denitrificans]MDU1494990.1 glycosyltransferase [Bradyrhizobium sp.]MDU1545077.1 glycosyltransferase [Bradyrhizobium sp.]MDU1802470.1 glycosyltransferase [Bradyrhizobium sp.]MDU2923703.1 glycosyltransferase [Bradyrhizobium sp.]